MSDFLDFVNSHKAEAYEIDMGKEFGNVWHILRKWQRKLSNAESPEEIQEVRQFAKKAYLSTKEDLLRLLEFQTLTKRHLAEIRIYFEYKNLYEMTEEPEEHIEKNKDKEIENMLLKAGYNDLSGLQKYLAQTTFKNKRLALLIFVITSKVVDNYNLKAFLRWMSKEKQYTGVSQYLKEDSQGWNSFEHRDSYAKTEFNEMLESLREFENLD